MRKTLVFAAVFGLIFGVPLTLALMRAGRMQTLWSVPCVVGGMGALLFLLRQAALVQRRMWTREPWEGDRTRFTAAEAAARRHVQAVARRDRLARENLVQMLATLPFQVGPLLVSILALFGVLAVLGPFGLFFSDRVGGVAWWHGLVVLASGLVGVAWLRLLERRFTVTIYLPVVLIRTVWVLYAVAAFGAVATAGLLFK